MALALSANSFSEYYNALISREPDIEEKLKWLQRSEVGERRHIEHQATCAFADMLHVMGVMIGDRKKRQYGATRNMDSHALALYKQETAVWFPKVEPRQLAPPTHRVREPFPHAAFQEMCEEEVELRRWLEGVELRLRENVERAYADSWYYMNCLRQLIFHEHRGRERVETDEHEAFTRIRRRVFAEAPADFFRQQVVQRYGASPDEADKALAAGVGGASRGELSLPEEEALGREKVVRREETARAGLFTFWEDAFRTRFFVLNHQEVIEREAIEEEERCALYPILVALNQETLDFVYCHSPVLALHCLPGNSVFAQVCRATCDQRRQRSQAFLNAFSEPLGYGEVQATSPAKKDDATEEEEQQQKEELPVGAENGKLFAAESATSESTTEGGAAVEENGTGTGPDAGAAVVVVEEADPVVGCEVVDEGVMECAEGAAYTELVAPAGALSAPETENVESEAEKVKEKEAEETGHGMSLLDTSAPLLLETARGPSAEASTGVETLSQLPPPSLPSTSTQRVAILSSTESFNYRGS